MNTKPSEPRTGPFRRRILFPGYAAFQTPLDREAFRRLAEMAAACGFTHVDLGWTLGARSRHQLPNDGTFVEGYDFYPEYAAVFPSFFKFFVPGALRPYLPADTAARNLERLHEAADALTQAGLAAAFSGNEPQILPEEAYRDHPHWRGPRCDFALRSRSPYFSPCVDQPEVLDLYREAGRALAGAAPNLDTLGFLVGDSGTGLCWGTLYPGTNGPAACAGRPMPERVKGLLDAMSEGFRRPGAEPFVYLTPRPNWNYAGPVPILQATQSWPVYSARVPHDKPLSFENPAGLLASLEAATASGADVLVVSVEDPRFLFLRPQAVYPALVETFLREPTSCLADRGPWLESLAKRLDLVPAPRLLVDAWLRVDQAIDMFTRLFTPNLFLYGSMSERWITRPLLLRPQEVPLEDRAYYRRHVFNVLGEDVGEDLLDYHGHRWPVIAVTAEAAERAERDAGVVAAALDEALHSLQRCRALCEGDASATACVDGTEARLRIVACFLKNFRNILLFQAMRDRLAAGGRKASHVTAQALEQVLRADIDNTLDLIRWIEQEPGAIFLAERPEDENTFRFGPEFTDQLRTKIRLMIDRWRDADRLLDDRDARAGQ